MFFVIDKAKFHRFLPLIRVDRRDRPGLERSPYLRLQAAGGELTASAPGGEVTIPATVYEPGVLFVRCAQFSRYFRSIRGQKMISIQANADGLFMDGLRIPLESNEMLLYADPAKAPQHCPLNDAAARQDEAGH